MNNEPKSPVTASTNTSENQQGAILYDRSSGSNRTEGGPDPEILITDKGNDVLVGNDGVDTYKINGINLNRVVTIKDQGINKLMIDGGNYVMELDIQKDKVLLDGKSLEKADESLYGKNAFMHKIDQLTLVIKPDSNISRKAQVSDAAAATNPLLQHMAHLPPETKLDALNAIHDQMLQQQNNSQKNELTQDADRQLV